jgi:hypothetical protein
VNGQGEIPVDRAAIYVEMVGGGVRSSGQTVSDGVTLPSRFLEKAAISGTSPSGYSVTAGTFIHQELNVPDDNWHGAFTGFSRDSILRRAILDMPVQAKDARAS